MFDNIIEFSSQESIIENKKINPIPCKLNIPKWFKELKHDPLKKTIKGCVPFLETLTTGYLLKTATDIHIKHNVIQGNEKISDLSTSLQGNNLNLNNYNDIEAHDVSQLGKCPFIQKNKNLPFQKILNPWKIKTPPGYSCFFLPPLNNADDRFSIIPGIVDTDNFTGHINFPIIMNGDKYPILETTIEMGTSYVQVIPFKKESWIMKIGKDNIKDSIKDNIKFFYKLQQKIIHSYKTTWWNKKTWK